jgi:hypothetical protein
MLAIPAKSAGQIRLRDAAKPLKHWRNPRVYKAFDGTLLA